LPRRLSPLGVDLLGPFSRVGQYQHPILIDLQEPAADD
jgi:hypothetical protein